MPKKSWSELSNPARAAIAAVSTVEILVTLAAWRDLKRRPGSALRGPKPFWALVSLVQPVGPLAYFAFARRSATQPDHT
ncbi:PLDc N-terminal domain-containing protein [Nocardioides gilvus]|uniref:PLDc N-terminal domain-containing protein n=1 Tax=Nocardioides gilvus TaxID=1735589 RepID=UPI000D746FCF|nr:PLDc N-terminal domain-containing protein [Nocardioides gilvus]